MGLLYLLEDIRVPVLNEFMLAITTLGEETAFLVIALVLFWCVDKYLGYYILSVGFVGTILNQFLKLWFRIPRPWILDPNFTILEQAREAASGYSFSQWTYAKRCWYLWRHCLCYKEQKIADHYHRDRSACCDFPHVHWCSYAFGCDCFNFCCNRFDRCAQTSCVVR